MEYVDVLMLWKLLMLGDIIIVDVSWVIVNDVECVCVVYESECILNVMFYDYDEVCDLLLLLL